MERFHADSIDPDVLAKLNDAKNSPEAFGERMASFIRYLQDHPLSRTPSYMRIYDRLLRHCQALSPHQAYVLQTSFLGPPSTVGYDMVPTSRPEFVFPRDHGPKERSQVGWHFFVGSCWDTDGAEYGVELMFFQTALLPPAIAAGLGLSDDENQIVELQFAISERGGHHYQAEPVVLAGTSGLISRTDDPFTYRLGKNAIECHHKGEFFPLSVRAWGVDRGEERALTLGMDLTFSSGKETLLQGDAGRMPAVDGFGSLYYSIPNIQVDPAGGTITLDGRVIQIERGTFWFDHQWGYISGVPRSSVMRAANNTKDAPPIGWDWFMAQFGGDRQLTVFAPHSAAYARYYQQTGPRPPDTMSVAVAGTYMEPDRSTHIIRGSLSISQWVKAEHSPNPKRYAVTHTWYPARWEFTFHEGVPSDIRRFVMTPIVKEAQVGFFANGAQYAEGAVVLTTPDGGDVGRGFAESVAYADTRRTQHGLAGLPQTDEDVRALRAPRPSLRLRLANTLYVLRHKAELEQIIEDAAGLEFFVPPDPQPQP
jgi:predicted secreted hydrolase